jgi:hypothetical protein
MKKLTIWSNRDIDFDAWKADLIEYQKENEYDDPEDVTDSDVYSFIEESLSNQFDDEKYNLDVVTDGRILVIADLGLWHGRKQGYKILNDNVNNIFGTGEDYTEWYSDGHNIKATASHHDGTNYYEYRVIREDRNINNLLDAIYNGEEITRKKLNYYTKSLHPYVAKVYGW